MHSFITNACICFRWNYLNPLNLLEGNQRNPFYFVESTPFDNRGDFENYIVRLQSMPRLVITVFMYLSKHNFTHSNRIIPLLYH